MLEVESDTVIAPPPSDLPWRACSASPSTSSASSSGSTDPRLFPRRCSSRRGFRSLLLFLRLGGVETVTGRQWAGVGLAAIGIGLFVGARPAARDWLTPAWGIC